MHSGMKFKIVALLLSALVTGCAHPALSYQREPTGTESGGGKGGSTARKKFYSPVNKALELLATQDEYFFVSRSPRIPSVKVRISDLLNTLRDVTLIPTSEQLLDQDGVQVDLVNYADSNMIKFNETAWDAKTEFDQFQLGIHELLGIRRLPDPAYTVSVKLAEFAQANGGHTQTSGVAFCGITVDSFSTAIEQANVDHLVRGFTQDGAQVRTCEIRGYADTEQRLTTAVVAVFTDGAEALLVREKSGKSEPRKRNGR